jgi:hypothetical protein
VRGLIRILGFFMVAYFVLAIVKVVGEMLWPGSFKKRRGRR